MGSLPNRMLWHFLSGSAIIRPQEVIGRELNKNKDRLLIGLSSYTKQTQPSGERLKTEKKLEGHQLEFVQKLSRFLGLEELLSYDLFCSYLAYEYRSSKKSLQQVLSSDRYSQMLMYKIRDFYFTEKLYLLRCLKLVLSCGMDSQHPYKEVYSKFVEDTVDHHRLIHNHRSLWFRSPIRLPCRHMCEITIQSQYEACCEESLPTWETHGTLMTNHQAANWARQNLEEQCELLELMVIYFKDFEPDVNKFISLFEKFKRQGFSQHQTFKHILDDTSEELLKRLGYLQVLVILDGLDFELIHRCHLDGSFDGHPLLKDKQVFQKLDKLMVSMGSSVFHGPLLLSWLVIRHMYRQGDDDGISKKIGMTALQLNCFSCLSDLLSTEPFNGKSIEASISSYLIYMLMFNVLNVFHEDRLGDTKSLNRLCEVVMKQEFVSDHVWEQGMETGLGTLYHLANTKFPMDFSPFLQLGISLATAGRESAKNVLSHLQQLQVYTEYLDGNSTQDLHSVGDSLWRLTRDKKPYGTGGKYSLVIPRDTLGMLYKQDKGSPIIQWAWSYNGWNLCMCEIDQLLQQLSHGAGMVSLTQISKVTQVVSLINAVLSSNPSSIYQLEGSCDLIYQLIQRCARLSSPPLQLLSNALDCLSCMANKNPLKIWHGVKQTGLLPFLTENLDNMSEVLSGQGLHAGLYGSLLAGHECSEGTYPVTQAYLNLLCQMVKPLRKAGRSEELFGSVLFILREVFPVFHKWRYYDKGRIEVIGQKCLDLFHRILDFLTEGPKATVTVKRLTLQSVCVHCLLYTMAGQALLHIVATGVDNIEAALAQQTSTFEGAGVELIQLTQLSFSVLNRLLLLKSPDLPMSPVEHALSSQPAGRQHHHIVVTVSQYIYHRHDPRLPTIATLLLKRLAVISPMSILACLGNEAEPIRDMYLMRLQATTEAVRLKVCIMELLTACVQTQPGLIELFLNVQPKAGTDGKKDLSLGKISCLQTVLDLIDKKRQGTYQCPPVLLCACAQFVHSLWAGLRETAMAVLRSRTTFWPNLLTPLMTDLTDTDDNAEIEVCLKTAAYVMKILAQEFYSVSGSKLDKTLRKVLGELQLEKRLLYWSQCVQKALVLEGENENETEEILEENPALQLLSAWKNLLVTMTSQTIEELQINGETTEKILSNLMSGLRAQFSGTLSVLNVKLASISSALYFTLICKWAKSVRGLSSRLKEVELALVQTCINCETLIASVQVGLLGASAALIQQSQTDTGSSISPDNLCSLLAVVSPLVQQSTYQLQCQPVSMPTSSSAETSSVTSGMDIKLKLQVTALSLMCDLVDAIRESNQWLPILQQHTIISALLSSLQTWMASKQGLQYVHAALILFLTIAQSEKGAECLALGGLTEHTCLAICTVYKNEDVLSAPSNLNKEGSDIEEVTWLGVYCLCLDLYTTMLRTLRFSFLKDALDFVGVHQDRLQQVLELSRMTLHDKVWKEAQKTSLFILQLSHFRREWRFEMPNVLFNLLTSISYMCHTLVSLLIRPRYLQHLLEHQSGISNGSGRGLGSDISLSRPQSLQTQASTEDVEQTSASLTSAQRWMFLIVGTCLSTLRQFTPDLCQIMMDMSLDISEFDPFLGLGFNTPSVDHESLPTFGTLISCVTVCVRVLNKMEHRVISPHKSPSASSQSLSASLPKSLINYVMETSLYIILSQACRYLKEPNLPSREKQLLKRELSTELNYFLTSYHRYLKRGSPPSPGGSQLVSPAGMGQSRSGATISRSLSSSTFTMAHDQSFCKLVQEFVKKVLR